MARDARPLRLAIVTGRPARRWQVTLAGALRHAGHDVAHIVEPGTPARSERGLELLLELERIAYGVRSNAFEEVDTAATESLADCDLAMDLRDRPSLGADRSRLVPLFDGRPGESALLAALIEASAPEITIIRSGDEPHVLARGLPALEERHVLARGLDQVLARTADLLRRCVDMFARGEATTGPSASPALQRAPAPFVSFAAKSLAARISQRLTRLAIHPDHGTTAFRRLQNDAVAERCAWPAATWTRVSDDGKRYFADPFPFIDNGRTYVFCEEYPYATRKGILSLFEIVEGVASTPL